MNLKKGDKLIHNKSGYIFLVTDIKYYGGIELLDTIANKFWIWNPGYIENNLHYELEKQKQTITIGDMV
jgi:hypothetical protein